MNKNIKRNQRPYRLSNTLVALLGLQTVLTIWLSITLLVNQIMPGIMAVASVLAMSGLNLVTLYQFWHYLEYQMKPKKRHVLLILSGILLAISALVMIEQSERLINKIRMAHDHRVYLSLVVPKGSMTLEQVKHIKYARLSDQVYLDTALEQLNLESSSVVDYQTLVKNLFNSQATAILINEAYRDLITEAEPDFAKKTKILRTFKFDKEKFETLPKQSETSSRQTAFNVYISGIDTYGNIAAVSRSDVNIVASINSSTRQIVLVNVPRDAYVKIPGGGQDQFDKLTHAGLYGASASMGALENLLGVSIKYYVRINFTSLIRVIDYFDVVVIDNPVSFKAVTGDYFAQGRIKVNSRQALAYARERKNLSGGDFDRGANQQRLIQAIFERISRQKNLANLYQAIERLSDAIQTNIPRDQIKQLLSAHIAQEGNWHFETLNVTGRGQIGGLRSFAMPNANLYMMVPDPQSINQAQARIKNNLQ